jgi:hypothetical protein
MDDYTTNVLVMDRANNIPRYKTVPKDLEDAENEFKQRFSESNMINKKTVYDRKHSRIAGILGEIVFKKIYPEANKSKDMTYDFDLQEKKVDVKCKYRTVIPRLDYEASFFLYQADEKFNADVYYFMSTIPSFEYVWICGYATKRGILENPHTEIWKQGEIDENNGMTFRQDTICLKYKYLIPIGI